MMTKEDDKDNQDIKLRELDGGVDPHPIKHASDVYGEWGPVQLWITILYVAFGLMSAFQNVGVVFYVPKVDFFCTQPTGYEGENVTKCTDYRDSSKPCSSWTYDRTVYGYTMIEAFNLVCQKEWYISWTKSIYQMGYFISSLLSGWVSDRYGRLFSWKVFVILEIITGCAQAFAPNIEFYLLARLLVGIGAYGRFTTGRLLILEMVGVNYRGRVRMASEAGWWLSMTYLPYANYLVKHFRNMQLIVVVYQCAIVGLLFLVPESPRWLLTNGRVKEACDVIKMIAMKKGELDLKEIDDRVQKLKEFVEEEEKNKKRSRQTLLDLWKVPILLKFCAALYFIYFGNMLIYYGFSYNAASFGGSLYWAMFWQGIAEIVEGVTLFFILDLFKRKRLFAVFCVLAILALFSSIPFTFSSGGATYVMALSTIGKVCVMFLMNMGDLMATEIFPTSLRQIGLGSCSFVSRIGSMLAPFTKELAEATHMSVMIGMFGTFCIFDLVALLVLPETKDQEMPDTIDEAREQFAVKTKIKRQVSA